MSTVVEALRLEHDQEAGAVPVPRPRLSWTVRASASAWRQSAAELSLTREGSMEETVHLDGNASVLVAWPFPDLTPRERCDIKVRVRGEDAHWSDWSAPTPLTASFMGSDEWNAAFIGLESPERHAQPALLRHEFDVSAGLSRATLYATAHGVYQAWVNGTEIDDQMLKPGWTPYQFRLVHETTDITEHLVEGRNALGVALAGGWFTESYGFQGQARPFYGVQPSFAGTLLLEFSDGSHQWVTTDQSWLASSAGPVHDSGIYHGETYDARRCDATWTTTDHDSFGWEPVGILESGPVPGPRNSPVVRITQEIPAVEVLTSPSGRTLLDFRQNLVGRLRIRVSGEAGRTVTLRHAEVLDAGELGVRPLRDARATDHYTLSGTGDESWSPRFTFHGFRYAEITGWPGVLDPTAIVAEVIGSDMRRTGWFECSDPMVNQLHENVVWGMRGNFLYVPTDCPQRDERLGWTGDIQIFGPTASFLYDCDGFLSSWLTDLALEQDANGGSIGFVVPDVLDSGQVPAAAWGDVATLLPWVLHERFGDRGTLEAQYPSMKGWVDTIVNLAGDRYLWEGGFQFGDWVDPDAPADDPARAKTDPDLLASAFLFRSTTVLSRTAALLGFTDEAEHYSGVASRVREAWLAEYVTPAGRLLSDAQTAYALALEFHIVPEELRQRMGDRLAWLVRRDGYCISTGFVGTPLVNDALTTTGHIAEASRMLLQTECPSWLYSVKMGATTIWERWDSLLEDGSINPGEMTSFNHYALGSVADWLHRVVAGLAPAAPGYEQVLIAPRPLPGLDWARAHLDGPHGTIEVSWRRDNGNVLVCATIPPNSSAMVDLPGLDVFTVGSGSHVWEVHDTSQRDTSPITMETPLSEIIDDEEAYDAVLGALDLVSPTVGADFRRQTRWVPNQPLAAAVKMVTPQTPEILTRSLAGLNASRSAV